MLYEDIYIIYRVCENYLRKYKINKNKKATQKKIKVKKIIYIYN